MDRGAGYPVAMSFVRSSALAFALVFVGCGGTDGEIGPAPEDAAAEVDDPFQPDTGTLVEDTSLADTGSSEAATDAGDAAKPDTPKPDAATACQAALIELGVSFKTTAARGVVDAVKLNGPINGVTFANGTSTTTMGDPVACEFVKTLHAFAGLAKSKGFVRIGTLGSYCYRCCCAWSSTNFCRGLTDPEPSCGTSGYSTHSWGRAVDVRYLYKADGTRYDINDATHWVKYGSTDTCVRGLADQPAGSISQQLYQLACDATKNKIFGIVLTPNYNAAHRNHLHMDIGEKGTPSSFTTKSLPLGPAADFVGIDDAPVSDACGDE